VFSSSFQRSLESSSAGSRKNLEPSLCWDDGLLKRFLAYRLAEAMKESAVITLTDY